MKAEYEKEKRFKIKDIQLNLRIVIVCELWLNHQQLHPDIKTGTITDYELNQSIEFPIRVCDLTPNTHVGITIYDLYRESKEGPLASTFIDVFDKMDRMRQGTYNLHLWTNHGHKMQN